jgi:endonuclease/exonuclease/phosphatase family metal-dependent hydrolase
LTSETGIKVVTWNMAHGFHGFEGMVHDLAALNPDIAVAIEADPKDTDTRPIFQKAFPDHHVTIMGGGIVLVSRWPAGETRPYHVGDPSQDSRIREVDVETPYGTWTVFGVDLASSPYYSRHRTYEELAAHIAARSDRPVIVAGDFNTPVDSVHYEHFRKLGLKELFLTAGQGYLPTWPAPTPVLSLDQIWVNDKLKPVECHREWSWHSDHAGAVGTVAAP